MTRPNQATENAAAVENAEKVAYGAEAMFAFDL